MRRSRRGGTIRRLTRGGRLGAVALCGAMLTAPITPAASAYDRLGAGRGRRVALATVPGMPGVPQSPTTVFNEDFENRNSDLPVRLNAYTGAGGMTYTADQAWLENCNGWVAAFSDPGGADPRVAPQVADCTPGPGGPGAPGDQAWNHVRQLSQALGVLNQTDPASANHAVSASTNGHINNGDPGANKVEFQQGNPPGSHTPISSTEAWAPAPPKKAGKGTTQVAKLSSSAPRYARPGERARGRVPSRWLGRQSALPVIASRSGWVKVRLARRPNGSTAWLRTKDVTLSTTPYRIVIDLSSRHLKLYKRGRRVMSAPAGVGAPGDPTPTGRFFVAFRQGPPHAHRGYGPFMLVTSAHSLHITNWEGSGDAVIGIHGPLGRDRAIGSRGARISHGCIRLHTRSLIRLRAVPPGTPIDIVH